MEEKSKSEDPKTSDLFSVLSLGFFLYILNILLSHGDICKIQESRVSTCQFLRNCQSAITLLKARKKPQLCNFDGSSAHPVVCCEKAYTATTTTKKPDPEQRPTGNSQQGGIDSFLDSIFTTTPASTTEQVLITVMSNEEQEQESATLEPAEEEEPPHESATLEPPPQISARPPPPTYFPPHSQDPSRLPTRPPPHTYPPPPHHTGHAGSADHHHSKPPPIPTMPSRPSTTTPLPPSTTSTVETPTAATGAVSKLKCAEYSESVFYLLPDPISPDEVVKVDSCIISEPLLVHNLSSVPREYPHMAIIGFGDKDSIKWLCGGSLISERFVLTASHCVDGNSRVGPARWVRLGEYNLGSDDDDKSGLSQPVDYEISSTYVHPAFNPPNKYNDIALVKLSKEVEFNEYVRPACLHTEQRLPESHAVASAWAGGPENILGKVNLEIIAQKECAAAWNSTNNRRLKDGILESQMICVRDTNNMIDTCQGDSGGPLQVKHKAHYCMYSIIGITSLRAGCGGRLPEVYTRVSYYVPWIEAVVWPIEFQ